jgi:fructokinase
LAILCSGEVLWDVFGEKELLGGAPLNFAVSMMRLGYPVALLTALGDDARGHRAMELIRAHGLSTEWVQIVLGAPTGAAIVTTDSKGNATYRIQRPAAFDSLVVDDSLLRRIELVAPDWFYFGTLAQSSPGSMALVEVIRQRWPRIKCFYDANLREGHWNMPLVQQLSSHADIMQLNEAEARILQCELGPLKTFSLEGFCREWSERNEIGTLCVTLGSNGCAVFSGGNFSKFDGFQVDVVDTVGAGDAFAAAFLHGIISGWPVSKTASFANALGAFIAGQAGAVPDWTLKQVNHFLSGISAANRSRKQTKGQTRVRT